MFIQNKHFYYIQREFQAINLAYRILYVLHLSICTCEKTRYIQYSPLLLFTCEKYSQSLYRVESLRQSEFKSTQMASEKRSPEISLCLKIRASASCFSSHSKEQQRNISNILRASQIKVNCTDCTFLFASRYYQYLLRVLYFIVYQKKIYFGFLTNLRAVIKIDTKPIELLQIFHLIFNRSSLFRQLLGLQSFRNVLNTSDN